MFKKLFGIIVLLYAILYIVNNTINLKKSQLDLINEGIIDLSSCKGLDIKQDTPFTCFFQDTTDVANIRNHYISQYNIELPEFNFDPDKHYIAISIGRKIVDITYHKIHFNSDGRGTRAHITFDSMYSEGRIYIYQMDKVRLEDEFLYGNYYYIMHEGKKELIGRTILDINR